MCGAHSFFFAFYLVLYTVSIVDHKNWIPFILNIVGEVKKKNRTIEKKKKKNVQTQEKNNSYMGNFIIYEPRNCKTTDPFIIHIIFVVIAFIFGFRPILFWFLFFASFFLEFICLLLLKKWAKKKWNFSNSALKVQFSFKMSMHQYFKLNSIYHLHKNKT